MDKKKKILIVEDEAIVAKGLQYDLKKMGYDVPFLAASGEDAIEITLRQSPDLVLMDIVLLGEIDGIEAAQRIRSTVDIPIIYLTAYSDKSVLDRAKLTEPLGYLIKPVADRELRSVIELALYKHDAEKALKESHERLLREEEELRKHREHLAALVEERTSELSDANKRLQKEMVERKILEEAFIRAEEEKQQHIVSELHDSLGQVLSAISLKSQGLEDSLNNKSIPEAKVAARIKDLIEQAKNQVRFLMKGISPIENSEEGTISAFEDLAVSIKKSFNISCVFKFQQPLNILNESTVKHLFRITQEAVTNAAKHGNPDHIEISLFRENGSVRLTINDDGTGCDDLTHKKDGMGLKIMKYRSNLINADLDIRSEAGRGTMISCTVSNAI